jgi:hypothetical protein
VPRDDDDPMLPPEMDEPSAEPGDGGARRFVSETVRKAVLTGLGAVFLTEESARKFAREWKLPKEIVGYVLTQASGAKDEIVRVVSEEVRKLFESEAFRREFLRLISSMSVEVHAEVSLKPSGGGKKVEPRVKVASVKPRIRRDKGAADAPSDGEGGEDEG